MLPGSQLCGPSRPAASFLSFSTGLGIRSDFKQPAAEGNGHRMRSVVGTQFVDEVLDVEVNRGLRDRELIGNLFVPIAIANEPQHLQLASRKILFAKMLRKAGGHLGWNMSFPRMHRANDGQQVVFLHALENVTRSTATPT